MPPRYIAVYYSNPKIQTSPLLPYSEASALEAPDRRNELFYERKHSDWTCERRTAEDRPQNVGTIALCFQGADRTQGALPPKVRDKNFAIAIAGVPLGGISEFHVLDVEAVKQFSNFGNIIQRQHKLTAKTTKPFFEHLEVTAVEVVVVQGAPPVRGSR
jgi:hypothetical protein